MLDFFYSNFTIIFLIVGLTMKMLMHSKSHGNRIDALWITIISMTVLIVADALEVRTSQDPSLLPWRVFFSALCYSVRPLAALGFLLVIGVRTDKLWLYWIPAVFNALLMFSAFFFPLPFYFNEYYSFMRGPLWYSTLVVSAFYIAGIIVVTVRKYRRGTSWESLVIYLCAAACLAAGVMDIEYEGRNLTEAIMVSAVFYYMFIRSQDNSHDILTGLRNRHSFQADCEYFEHRITAMAMLDMNGLKKINDESGHDAGDQALIAIARVIDSRCSPTAIPFRVGGDEFVILFLGESEELITDKLESIRNGVCEAGYVVSVGYARRNSRESIHDLYTEADRAMYSDKQLYYQNAQHDRRHR